MSIGSILIGAGLLWLSFTVVLRPWRAHNDELSETQGDEQGASGNALTASSLTARRDSIYGALADLDFDRSIGKLNDDDYQVVRSQLMAQAVDVLKQIDTASTSAASEASIESDVEALVRARRKEAPARQSGGRQGALVGSINVYCTGCGSALKPDDDFCGKCGRPVANRCPHCDAAVGAGDAFCIRCGTRLLAAATA